MNRQLNQDAVTGILSLAEVSRGHIKQVGNKAALLGELLAAGLPAAPGLVVCSATAAGLRAAREFSPKLLADLEAKLDQQLPDATAFAVRTSWVENPRGSAQRQHASRCEYFVPRDALPIAIIACASAPLANLEQPASPLTAAGNPPQAQPPAPDCAVLVQPMIHAHVSGIAFTGGVQGSGVDTYLVEACWGLGRALLEGQTDPDRYTLNRNNRVIEQQRGRKQHKEDPTSAGTLVSVSEAERLEWTLNDSQLTAVTALAKRCESVLGGVQDIAFAFSLDAPNEPVLLRSKPVTAAKLAPENIPAGKWLVYQPLLENFSEPFTPLTEDLLRMVLPGFARTIHGRVYLDFDKLKARLPLHGTDAELTEGLLFQQDLTRLPVSFGKLLRRLPLWLTLAPWAGVFSLRSRSLSKRRLEQFSDYADKLAADASLNARDLFIRFTRGKHLFSAPWRTPFLLNLSSTRHLFYTALLNRLVKRWTSRELDDGTLQQLCTGNADTLSNDMVADIEELGRSVANMPELASAFGEPLDGLALHKLLDAHANPGFLSQFSNFVQRFGHRSTREFELASSSWAEHPTSLLALIGIQSKSLTVADGYGMQLLARDDLHQALQHPWQRKIVDRLLRRIRYYVSLRENTRHYVARALFLVRQRLLQTEDRLLREGKLQQAGDLFYLTWADVCYLDNEQLSPDDAATLIIAARDQHTDRCSNAVRCTLGYQPADDAAAPEAESGSHQAPHQDEDNRASQDLLRGRCAAPGSSEGIARVVLNGSELAAFQPGEVLVLAFADPTMAAAVRAASGVICERGSYMSHLSVLAREWGVPFVVSADNSTRAITTGERVRLDATAGYAQVLPAESSR